VACQSELVSLARAVKGVEMAAERNGTLPRFDLHCPLLSLPRVFKTTLQNVPANVPYIRASGEKWRGRVPSDGRRKVGLVWAGGKHPPGRSIELESLAALAEIPNLWLCSLQKGEAAGQIRGSRLNITDWTDELDDFADTAGLVENLDLVITVDTAVAHLAGAMGKPAWVLLKFVPDWRWMINGERTSWYPAMRLFRQERLGDWQAPLRKMMGLLG
jgi:hypothetical protein